MNHCVTLKADQGEIPITKNADLRDIIKILKLHIVAKGGVTH